MIKQRQDLLWHNVSTWSDTLPRPSVSPGRHTCQQCCICQGSQGSENCILKTAISYESIIHRGGICLCTTSWVILPFLIFPSLKNVLVKTSKHYAAQVTKRLCIPILHLLYGFVGLRVAFFVVEQGAVSDLVADWPFKSLLLLLFDANCQKL